MPVLLRPRRRLLILLTALCCLLGGLGLIVPDGDAVARAAPLRTGLGHHTGRDFVGFYLTRDGRKVYCLDPRKGTPATVTLHGVARYPGLSGKTSAALAYALAVWGNARSRNEAAVTSQVVNTLAGNRADVARRARSLPPSLRRLTSERVQRARTFRGPYVVRVTTPVAVLPGQSATGTVRVYSASGAAMTGIPVMLRGGANLSVPTAVRTGRRGTADFRYTATDVGAATVRATVTGLPATALLVSSPHRGEQHMAAPAARVGVAASASFRATPQGMSHRYACASDCDGRPDVSVTACAAASRTTSRVVIRVGPTVIVHDFVASARRHCWSAVRAIPDGTRITASWQFGTRHGWSAPVSAAGAFVVDCPPVPALALTMTQDCVTARVTLSAAPSDHATMLVVGGARRAVVIATARKGASWSTSAPCGSRMALTAHAAVRRANGAWNVGRSMSVTTP